MTAGSFRRKRETVGDIDLLAAVSGESDIMNRLVEWEDVERVVSHGRTRATVILRGGLQVDLRAVPAESLGAAFVYFTGSKAHNIALRKIAVGRGLKMNEYGVFRGERRLAGRTEEEVYAAVGLPWMPPELREDRGEIDAARHERLPRLVALDDIRGDLHAHTKATDGHDSIRAMAEAAMARGYDYLAVTDHSRHLTVAHGLDPRRLARQIDEIERLEDGLDGITLLKGCEVDILKDGALDLPDSILARLDLAVCAVHYKFELSAKAQTERILRAMDNPHFTVLAHPSGRLLGKRPPYAVDMERIAAAAAERGCFLEVNGQPERLDLSDVHARMAKDAGVKLSLATDAHRTGELDFMAHAVDQARRGWIEPDDVLNARPLGALRKLLKRR